MDIITINNKINRAIILTVIQQERWAICPCLLPTENKQKLNKNQHEWNRVDAWISNVPSVFAQKHIVCENQWIGGKV